MSSYDDVYEKTDKLTELIIDLIEEESCVVTQETRDQIHNMAERLAEAYYDEVPDEDKEDDIEQSHPDMDVFADED